MVLVFISSTVVYRLHFSTAYPVSYFVCHRHQLARQIRIHIESGRQAKSWHAILLLKMPPDHWFMKSFSLESEPNSHFFKNLNEFIKSLTLSIGMLPWFDKRTEWDTLVDLNAEYERYFQ